MMDLNFSNQCNQFRKTSAHRLTHASSALWGQTWAGGGNTWLKAVTEGVLAPAAVMLEKHVIILGFGIELVSGDHMNGGKGEGDVRHTVGP
jgi:hypothetical protein